MFREMAATRPNFGRRASPAISPKPAFCSGERQSSPFAVRSGCIGAAGGYPNYLRDMMAFITVNVLRHGCRGEAVRGPCAAEALGQALRDQPPDFEPRPIDIREPARRRDLVRNSHGVRQPRSTRRSIPCQLRSLFTVRFHSLSASIDSDRDRSRPYVVGVPPRSRTSGGRRRAGGRRLTPDE